MNNYKYALENYNRVAKIVNDYNRNNKSLEDLIQDNIFSTFNYEKNEYCDLEYGNITMTITINDNKMVANDKGIVVWNNQNEDSLDYETLDLEEIKKRIY